MPNAHIARDFDQAIHLLREDVLAMAERTRLNLRRAVDAVLSRNAEQANAVIADDDEVDEFERKIDRMGMSILVRFHPLASDLRLVLSSMKICNNLERISDHATNIAKRARKMSQQAELPDTMLIQPLYQLADQLLEDAMIAYRDRDSALGVTIHQRDKELDRQHKVVVETYSSRIEFSQGRSSDYLHLILIVRSLERVGDLAANIGEDAVFLDIARDMRHTKDREL